MNILTRDLLLGPAPKTGSNKDFATYYLRLSRLRELQEKRMVAYYVRSAKAVGLSNREIGEILGHTEGWVRQYIKDTAGKTELWDFADGGFRGNVEAHNQFFKDIVATNDFEQKLHLCAEYRLSDEAVASVTSIPEARVAEYMEGPRAEAAA